jgi:HEAT repeat protein
MVLVLSLSAAAAGQQPPPGGDRLTPVIAQLGSFDFPQRVEAARTLRRGDRADVVPALEAAARGHADEFVRFRAFVLLTGIDEAVAARLAADLLADRNDRVRTVAYQWFEHHPEAAVLPRLLEALPREQTGFVRPALTRALAAQGSDPRVEKALQPLVLQGEDLFRGSVIAALGEHGGRFALREILEVATLDGPLQDDAIVATGRLGGAGVQSALASLQRSAPPETQPVISAALCLLGVDCAARLAYLRDTLVFAAARDGQEALLRGAAYALGVVAVAGHPDALAAVFDAAQVAPEGVRAPLALAAATVAVRKPIVVLDAVEQMAEGGPAADLLLEGFDMLSEDYAEEQFYVRIRQAFWQAPEASRRRGAAELLIGRLEF